MNDSNVTREIDADQNPYRSPQATTDTKQIDFTNLVVSIAGSLAVSIPVFGGAILFATSIAMAFPSPHTQFASALLLCITLTGVWAGVYSGNEAYDWLRKREHDE